MRPICSSEAKLRRRPRQAESGSALVLALIAALLLFIVSFEVAHTTRIESFIAHNVEVDAKLDVACRAGLEKALALLREDRQQTEIDSTNDIWWGVTMDTELIEADVASEEFLLEDEPTYGSTEDEETRVVIQIFDECAKFNLYLLRTDDPGEQRLRRERLANVIDKFREDTEYDLSHVEGGEIADAIRGLLERTDDSPYQSVPNPPKKGAETFLDVAEILYADGIEPSIMWDLTQREGTELVPGLFRFVTIWSDLQININTGELPSLAGLFEVKEAHLADSIVEYRTNHEREQEDENLVAETGTFDPEGQDQQDPTGGAPFTQINELRQKVDGMTQETYGNIQNFVTVQSNAFSVFVTATRGFVRRTKMFVVRRSEAGFRILLEKRVDFPYFIPEESLQTAEEDAEERFNSR